MDVRLPKWLEELPEDQQKSARARFMLRLAALYHSEGGKMNVLSSACDLNPTTLSGLNSISPELAICLESVLGAEMFPRVFFRPDLFTSPATPVE